MTIPRDRRIKTPALVPRHPAPTVLHPDAWPERRGRARVLVEHPDAAELWAHAETLRAAGFDAAVCPGPTRIPPRGVRPGYFEEPQPRERAIATCTCPVLGGVRCPLAEDADVIVTSAELVDGAAIAAVHEHAGAIVVIEEQAVTERQLLDAVESALG